MPVLGYVCWLNAHSMANLRTLKKMNMPNAAEAMLIIVIAAIAI